jgi:hypothetical protein
MKSSDATNKATITVSNIKFGRESKRGAVILSTEERELEYIKNHKPFKAKPVSQSIINSSGDLGVPRVKKRSVTEPVSPKFHYKEKKDKEVA